jgi:hypothetical protein
LNQLKLKILSITSLLLALTFGIAFAAVITSHSVTNTITINQSSQGNFDVYTDASCTQQLSTLSWDSMENGQWQERTIYLQNTGSSTIYVWWDAPDLATGFSVLVSNPVTQPFPTSSTFNSPFPTYTPSPSSGLWYPSSMYKVALQPGEPVEIEVWLTSNGVSSGSYSWTLTFTGEDS